MLGRKRETLEPRRLGLPSQGSAAIAKQRRWRRELDDGADSGDEVKITTEELEQWRRREAVVGNASVATADASGGVGAAAGDAQDSGGSAAEESNESPDGKRPRKMFAWMDSDEEEGGDADDAEADKKNRSAVVEGVDRPDCVAGSAHLSVDTRLGISALPPPVVATTGSTMAAVGVVPLARNFDEERFLGRIKRYTDMAGGGGYGFIDCDEARLRFGRDVYIHKNQMIGLNVGTEVNFGIVRNHKGEPQARNVMRAEDALLLRAAPVALQPCAAGAFTVGASSGEGVAGIAGATHVPPHGAAIMDEEQAKRFQASLRSSVH